MRFNKLMMGIAAAAVATVALASVTFDSSTGKGFVGKGDVQLKFGWTNAQLQTNATGVTFTYNAVDSYDAECYWETTTGGPQPKIIVHDIFVPKHTSVFAALNGDPRQTKGQKQFTGFILNGWNGAPVIDGTVPVVGDACPGNSGGTIIALTLVSSTGGLYVNWNGISYSLPNTPIL